MRGLALTSWTTPTWVLIFLLLFCASGSIQVSADTAVVSFSPQSNRVWGADATFTVDIVVSDVANLYGWQFTLYYDSSLLNGTAITEGSFLKGVGNTYFVSSLNDDYDATHGIMTAACSLLGNVPGTAGSGTLATIAFTSKAFGNCLLTFSKTKLGDPHSLDIAHDVLSGAVEILPPIHDVAVRSVALARSQVAEGRSVNVSVVVANKGNATEDFGVNLYANDTLIGSLNVVNLIAGAQRSLIFTWNTTGLLINSTYGVKAEATAVVGETNLGDNALTDGFLHITEKQHDVAIKRVTPQYTTTYEGREVNITVVATNKGDYSETFDVSLFYDNTAISTQHIANLSYGQDHTLKFVWDTTGVPSNMNYSIKATASQVSGETNVEDNTYVDGTITLLPAGAASVTIISITPSDQNGLPVSGFTVGTMAYFKVVLNCNSIVPEFLLLTINTYGANNVSIAVISFRGLVAPGSTAFVLGSMIPATSAVGNAVVYADALTDWPHLGGTPYCPEKSAVFQIRGS
jgi:hypothetical protein